MSSPRFSIHSTLRSFFESHGLKGKFGDGWLNFAGHLPPIQCEIVRENVLEQALVVQLDVRVALSDGRTLMESFAGAGPDRPSAERDAFRAFIEGAFHPILKALYDPNDAHIEAETWRISGTPRRIAAGPAVLRGSIADGQSALPCLTMFDETLKTSDLAPALHWIRTYVGQMDGRVMQGEVLLDNEPWPALENRLRALPWPKVAPFYSLRRFLIVQDAM